MRTISVVLNWRKNHHNHRIIFQVIWLYPYPLLWHFSNTLNFDQENGGHSKHTNPPCYVYLVYSYPRINFQLYSSLGFDMFHSQVMNSVVVLYPQAQAVQICNSIWSSSTTVWTRKESLVPQLFLDYAYSDRIDLKELKILSRAIKCKTQ